MRLRSRQDVEREGQQAVARQDRRGLIVLLVCGRPAAAEIVIVHRRQVVMRKRITVHAFECGAGHQRLLARRLEQGGGLDHEKRAQPLAAAERHVAHRVHDALRPRALPIERRRAEQPIEQALGVGGALIEPLPELALRVGGVVHGAGIHQFGDGGAQAE